MPQKKTFATLMTTAIAAVVQAIVPRQSQFAYESVGSDDTSQTFFGRAQDTLKSAMRHVDGSERARKMHLDRVMGKDTEVTQNLRTGMFEGPGDYTAMHGQAEGAVYNKASDDFGAKDVTAASMGDWTDGQTGATSGRMHC